MAGLIRFCTEKHGKGSGIPKRLQPFIADMNHELLCMHYSLPARQLFRSQFDPTSFTTGFSFIHKNSILISLLIRSEIAIWICFLYRDTLFTSKVWFDTHFVFQLSIQLANLTAPLTEKNWITNITMHHACIHNTNNT